MNMRDHLDQTVGRDLVVTSSGVPTVTVGRSMAVGSIVRLCAAVFSWMLGERAAKKGGDVYQLQASLLLYGDEAGLELDARPSTRTSTILRRLGLTRSDVQLLWHERRAQGGYEAVLPADLLTEIFPTATWDALAALVCDGPAICSQHIDKVLHKVSLRPAAKHAGGEDGARVSRKTLNNYAWPLSWTMRTLVDLRDHGFPCSELEQWTRKPTVRVPCAPYANTDRSAPRWRLTRLLMQRLDRYVQSRLGASGHEEELEVLRTCSIHRISGGGVWLAMRLRALFALCCCLGGRSGAACDLRRGDVITRHTGPDGRCGPAIALRPGKTYATTEIHYKPIPHGLLQLIEILNLATDRILAEAPDYEVGQGRIARPPPPPDLALFPKSLREPGRALSQPGFYLQLVGYKERPTVRRKARAPLLPRADGRGFSPHTLRGSSMQMIKHATREYLPVNHPDITPEDLAEALVDHEVPGDAHGYFDKNTLRGRELLSGIATELAWRMLTTELGARKVRDAAAYREVLRRTAILGAELQQVQRSISTLLKDPPSRKDEQLRTLLEVQALNEQREQLRERLNELEQRSERLRHDPATRTPASDELSDEELVDRLEEVDREFASSSTPRASRARELPVPVREPPWFTIPEAASVMDISYPQIARWAKGKHLPYPAGDPRNPWSPERIPIDVSRGERRRRISVQHVNPAYLQGDARRRRLAEILARFPARWSDRDSKAPLVLPAALADDPSRA
jgi:integrase